MVDSILVSVDFSNKNDTGVMVVGRKRMNQSVERHIPELKLIGLGTMQEAKNKDVRKLHF